MPTKVFVDTNIIVDFLMKREPFDKPAALLFDKAHRGGIEAFVPATVFPFVFYLLSKSLNSKALAWEAVARFRQLVIVLPVDRQAIDLALASNFKDLEDAVQYQVAKSNAADFFITRNLKDFKKSDIPVLTAESFMQQFAD
ncbi:MAG: PIN domain-containing protein [Bacteroidetes bacterium]|jgi:predicted nucleic acid-binding protein|nr:PIN domain-containing protein [Bacteroidota bacterium]